jgi:hypothetical protein
VVALALVGAILAVPAQAPAAPAGSEYILRVPHARGDSSSSGVVPTTTSSSGTTTGPAKPKYRRPSGPADRRTGGELVSTDTSGSTSFLGALGAALVDPLVLALLGVIALGSAFALRTRHAAPEV